MDQLTCAEPACGSALKPHNVLEYCPQHQRGREEKARQRGTLSTTEVADTLQWSDSYIRRLVRKEGANLDWELKGTRYRIAYYELSRIRGRLETGVWPERYTSSSEETASDDGHPDGDRRQRGFRLPAPRCREFWGRDEETRQVREHLTDPASPQIAGLFAFGGYGKTELARSVAARLLAEGEFQDAVWLSFKEQEFLLDQEVAETGRNRQRRDAEDVLNSLALQLGVSRAELPEILREEQTLVVLDNLETAPRPRALLGRLAEMAGRSRVLVTSRRRFSAPFVEDFAVSGLGSSDSCGLLRSEAAHRDRRQLVNAPEATLEEIFRLTRGAPLALHLIVARTAFLDLDRVLETLKKARGPDRAFYAFLFRDAWEELSPEARQLLVYMGTTGAAGLPRGELEQAELVEPEAVDGALVQLAEWSLLEVMEISEAGGKLYDLHPLTRAFVCSDLRDEWEHLWPDYTRRAVRSRLSRLREVSGSGEST